MPIGDIDAKHLLRRTEVVARSSRIAELKDLTIAAAVANVLAVDAAPPPLSFRSNVGQWDQGNDITANWMNRMATVARPFGERMALFWHGHICTELPKTRSAVAMSGQINLFRTAGVNGNFAQLIKDMAIQPAMLRYLDNDKNFGGSSNQNFARELMELFVLGVGNYTEADVEAATAAWSGHGDSDGDGNGSYLFFSQNHDRREYDFLGRRINRSTEPYAPVANTTVDIMLRPGTNAGTIPVGPNAGRPAREVAAEFISKKLWQEFGEAESGGVPAGVMAAMRSALLDNEFAIHPWLTALFTHPDFYAAPTKVGLVRQPVDYVVGLMAATGLQAADAGQSWLLAKTGQRPLYPPNVSGWKPNGYWVNATAMEARNEVVQVCMWSLGGRPTWQPDDGYVDFPGGRFTKRNLQFPPGHPGRQAWETHPDGLAGPALVARILAVTGIELAAPVQARIAQHVDAIDTWLRFDALMLILLAPEMHIA